MKRDSKIQSLLGEFGRERYARYLDNLNEKELEKDQTKYRKKNKMKKERNDEREIIFGQLFEKAKELNTENLKKTLSYVNTLLRSDKAMKVSSKEKKQKEQFIEYRIRILSNYGNEKEIGINSIDLMVKNKGVKNDKPEKLKINESNITVIGYENIKKGKHSSTNIMNIFNKTKPSVSSNQNRESWCVKRCDVSVFNFEIIIRIPISKVLVELIFYNYCNTKTDDFGKSKGIKEIILFQENQKIWKGDLRKGSSPNVPWILSFKNGKCEVIDIDQFAETKDEVVDDAVVQDDERIPIIMPKEEEKDEFMKTMDSIGIPPSLKKEEPKPTTLKTKNTPIDKHKVQPQEEEPTILKTEDSPSNKQEEEEDPFSIPISNENIMTDGNELLEEGEMFDLSNFDDLEY